MALLGKSKPRELDRGYVSEVDELPESAWYQTLEQFDDANLYQTWAYDEVRSGRNNISHLVLRQNGVAVAIAQARLATIPWLKAGIAYVRWGPVWQRHDGQPDPEHFRQAVRALRNEYACRRGLVLRLYPAIFHDDPSGLASILKEEGFSLSGENPDRTLLLSLTPSLEDLRKGMGSHWRRYLKVAEKNGLEIIEGDDDKLFEMFIGIYRGLLTRKKFAEPNDIEKFRQAQGRLPTKFKMKIMLCKSGDTLCAGLVGATIGNTAIYLFGATSDEGLKSRGSYLLHWKFIEWLKQNGFTTYDLHGINPVTNPGTYKFKSDLCGENPSRDVYFLGRFDASTSVLSQSSVALGDTLRSNLRSLRKKSTDRAARASRPNSSPQLAPRPE